MKSWLHNPITFAPQPKLGGGWIAFKDSPSPPATPDYAAAAKAQGAANVDTAKMQGIMSNPNINTPYGSQTVTWGTPSFNQAGYDAAMAKYNNGQPTGPAPSQSQFTKNVFVNDGNGAGNVESQFDQNAYNQALAAYNAGPGAAPTRDQFTSVSNPDQPTVTQTLSPAQQQLLDSQNRISQNLAGVAETGLNRVSQGMGTPFNTSGLPSQASNVGSGQYATGVTFSPAQTGYASGGNIQYGTGYNQPITQSFDTGTGARNSTGYNQPIQNTYDSGGQVRYGTGYNQPIQGQVAGAGQQQTSLADVGSAQRGLDFSGAPALPGTNDFSADRDAVTNALLSRSEPQFQRDEELTRTRLINQGIAAGSEASNYDLDTLNRARNDARQQAILAGGQEQSRLFGLASQARGQYTGEKATQGNFANNAQSQAFNQGLAGGNFANQAQNTQFGQNLAGGQFANAAQQQGFGQSQADLAAYNQAQQQANQQALQGAQFANQAQGQGYTQAQGDLAAYNAAAAQNYGQNQGAAAFGNAAQAQGYTQAQGNAALNNAAQAQANAQNLNAGQFYNQGINQQFNMGQQNAALNNQAQQQMFTQGLANANLTNQARQQAIQEQAYLRSLPLNELNALRTGAQVQNPQFQPFQGVQVGQTPVFQAAQAQGQANQNLYNQQAASANAFNSGLMGIAGTAGGLYAGSPGGSAAIRGLFG